MQQRVGVVRALANEPDVLLMDEPFASVDAQTRMTLQEELTRIWQEKRPTVIFITHDVERGGFSRQPRGGAVKGSVLDGDRRRPAAPAIVGRAARGRGFKALTGRVLQLVRSALSHVARRAQVPQDARRCSRSVASYLAWQLWLTVAAPGKIAAGFPDRRAGQHTGDACRSRRSGFMSSCSRTSDGCLEHKNTPLKFGE